MLEVAIVSIKCALRDDFPEFSEFYSTRAWEKEEEKTEEAAEFECEIAAAREEEIAEEIGEGSETAEEIEENDA